MDVKQVLEELVAIPDQREPVASVYLDTRRTDEHQREAIRILVDDEARRALKARPSLAEQEALRKTLDPVVDYVTGFLRQQIDEQARGVALFSCAPIGLFRVVTARVPFVPMQFALESRPVVRPLVQARSSWPPVLIAAVESTGAWLYEVQFGEVETEARIDRPFIGRHSRGGWAQRRYQQHIGELRLRNLREVADPLVRLADSIPNADIVLAGQSLNLNNLVRTLPPRVVERVVARVPYPAGLPPGLLRETLLDSAQEQIARAQRERAREERDRALAEASRNGLGVAGMVETLLALNEGRAHRVLVDSDFRGLGWRCRSCEAVGEGFTATCDYCSGPVKDVDLGEELVRLAVRQNAEVVFLSLEDRLPTGVGLAATLRHRKTLQVPAGAEAEAGPAV